MSDEPPAGPVSLSVDAGARALSLDDLALLNRMTTTGLVLPNVAHELNNALQVIGGLVEMLGARPDLPPDVVDKVGRIGAHAARSAGMVRDLVAFSRRDHGGVGVVDLARVVEQALGLRRYHLSRARIAVSTDIADGGPWVVRADGHHLLQVVVNLVINAEQALEGRPSPALRIRIDDEAPDRARLSIDDNAGPLAAEVAARACEAFYTTRHGRGVGLGLAVGRALVASDGGTLDLQPLETGTRATISFARLAPVRAATTS